MPPTTSSQHSVSLTNPSRDRGDRGAGQLSDNRTSAPFLPALSKHFDACLPQLATVTSQAARKPGAAVAAPGLSAGAFRETLAAKGIIPHPTAEEEPPPPLPSGRRVTQPYVNHHRGMTPAWPQLWQANAAFANLTASRAANNRPKLSLGAQYGWPVKSHNHLHIIRAPIRSL